MLRNLLFSVYLIAAIGTPVYYFGQVFFNVSRIESPVIYNDTSIIMNKNDIFTYKHTLLYDEGNCVKEIYTLTDESAELQKWLQQNLTITAYDTAWGIFCDHNSLDNFITIHSIIGIFVLGIWIGFMIAIAENYILKP